METTNHIDNKADSINGFDLLANFMWRRANYLMQNRVLSMEQVKVLDPCAGGGKLLSLGSPLYSLTGYESDYTDSVYAEALVDIYDVNNTVHNSPFEEIFTKPYNEVYDLVISIPYTDRNISNIEPSLEYLKFKNYAYYIMGRSLDVLKEGGIAVFAIPEKLMDQQLFSYEIDCITDKANILSVESFEKFAIITLQKEK